MLTARNALAVVAVAMVTTLTAGAATYALTRDDDARPRGAPTAATSNPGPVVMTSLPGLPAPTGDPVLLSIATAHPAAGSVVQAAGPFDDRFALSALRLRGGAVSGRLHVISDVSDLLDLEVLVGFYDARGHLLGTARADDHATIDDAADTGPPSETRRFEVIAPARVRDQVRSAAVGVPVLVNE